MHPASSKQYGTEKNDSAHAKPSTLANFQIYAFVKKTYCLEQSIHLPYETKPFLFIEHSKECVTLLHLLPY